MSILVRIGGLALALLGLTLKQGLEAIFTLDGAITGAAEVTAIVSIQVVVVACGLWVFVKPPRLRMPTLGNCSLLVASTAIAIGFGEVSLRLLGTGQPPAPVVIGSQDKNGPFVSDPETGYRMRPSHVFQWVIDGHTITYRSNSDGFRSDREFVQSQPPPIALVGDSFTWGFGVDYEETFGRLVERTLANGEAFNFAMPGFGIDQMWMSVRHQVLPLKPGLVVVAFIDDDFGRSLHAFRKPEGFSKPRFVVSSGALRPQTPSDISILQTRSYAWRAVATAFERGPFGEWWVLNTKMIEAIAEECAKAGVAVLFVRLPEKSRRPFDGLRHHMDALGLEFLDLGGPDKANEVPGRLHFINDGHINAEGHRFVASEIVTWILEKHPEVAGQGRSSG